MAQICKTLTSFRPGLSFLSKELKKNIANIYFFMYLRQFEIMSFDIYFPYPLLLIMPVCIQMPSNYHLSPKEKSRTSKSTVSQATGIFNHFFLLIYKGKISMFCGICTYDQIWQSKKTSRPPVLLQYCSCNSVFGVTAR